MSGKNSMKFWGITAVAIILIAVIFFFVAGNSSNSVISDSSTSSPVELTSPSESKNSLWMNAELKDVRTQETFRISDFEGKPVLIESFAVWCPTCTAQQKETKKLEEEIGENKVISVSLDTDPNEDEEKILEHVTNNDFNWRYAVSPRDITESLIDEFGIGIVNAPQVPMVVICEDGGFAQLKGGIKRSAELKETISRTCGTNL